MSNYQQQLITMIWWYWWYQRRFLFFFNHIYLFQWLQWDKGCFFSSIYLFSMIWMRRNQIWMRGKTIIMRRTPAWLVQVCGGNNTHTHRNTGRERQQHERQQHPSQKNACMFVSLSSYPLGWGGMQVEYVYISCFLFFLPWEEDEGLCGGQPDVCRSYWRRGRHCNREWSPRMGLRKRTLQLGSGS